MILLLRALGRYSVRTCPKSEPWVSGLIAAPRLDWEGWYMLYRGRKQASSGRDSSPGLMAGLVGAAGFWKRRSSALLTPGPSSAVRI